MSKFDDCMEKYRASFAEMKTEFDDALLTKVAKGLGPSIYLKDASTIAGSDQKELDTVKNNFLIKKLGLTDGPELDSAIQEVIEKFGKSNKNKHRAVFYYLLAKKFGKESIYG